MLGIRQVASEHGAEAVAAVEFAPVSSDSDSAADGGPAFALRICTGEAAADIVAAAALKAARERRAQKSGMMPPSEAEQEQQHLLAYPLEVRLQLLLGCKAGCRCSAGGPLLPAHSASVSASIDHRQSNFSGAKYSLELINALREGRVVLQQAPEDGEGADMPMPAGRWCASTAEAAVLAAAACPIRPCRALAAHDASDLPLVPSLQARTAGLRQGRGHVAARPLGLPCRLCCHLLL